MKQNPQNQQMPPRSPTLHAEGRSNAEPHEIDDKYNFHDSSFRRHYQLNYAENGRGYEEFYAPAYRYGFELAEEQPNTSWEEIQATAQQHWQSQHPSQWTAVADAVRYGWEEQRNPEKLRVHHHKQFDDFQPGFEEHYADTFGGGSPFAHYAPAYRYGYDLAIAPEYRTHLWDDVEPEVREYWAEEYRDQLPWESYRDASRHAWEAIRAGAM